MVVLAIDSTSLAAGHKFSQDRAATSEVTELALETNGAPLLQLARTDSMECRGFCVRGERNECNGTAAMNRLVVLPSAVAASEAQLTIGKDWQQF